MSLSGVKISDIVSKMPNGTFLCTVVRNLGNEEKTFTNKEGEEFNTSTNMLVFEVEEQLAGDEETWERFAAINGSKEFPIKFNTNPEYFKEFDKLAQQSETIQNVAKMARELLSGFAEAIGIEDLQEALDDSVGKQIKVVIKTNKNKEGTKEYINYKFYPAED